MAVNRDKSGRFTKGNRCGGRTPMPPEFKAAAKTYAHEALETLVKIMRSALAEDAQRVSAAKIIIERAYGKPAQEVTATVTQTGDFVLEITGETEEAPPE